LDQAAKKGLFYVHDTMNVTDAYLPDHRQHRDLFANMAKRSHFFLVAPAKMDFRIDTGGQIEIGSRYFEGAAAGTVLIGRKPESESFLELFGWQDAVIDIESDGSDLTAVLSRLWGQPERRLEISRRNSVESLLRHDWVYRWKEILSIAGLKPRAAMEERERRLKKIAEAAKKGEEE
jgi:hypothetical protein